MLMAALALWVAASCGSAWAAGQKDWFNGGIGAGWPADATMFGGAWCKEAEERGRMLDDKTLQISADEEPLSFDATYPKPLGADASAANVVVDFSCAFSPFSLSALPEVPEYSKGAVILVTEDEDPDNATDGMLYYAAYDDTRGKNWWRASAVTGVGTGEVVRVVITVSPGSTAGNLSIGYTLANRYVVSEVPLRQSDTVANGMFFMGSGRTSGIEATYAPGSSHTLNLVAIPGLAVTNVTANGESVGSGYGAYAVGDGAEVVVYYAAATGYKLKDGYDGIVPIGYVTKDTTVNENTPGIPEVEALGTYLVRGKIYADFVSMCAELEDGDRIEMLREDTLPAGATLSKTVTVAVGGYVLSGNLTIAADVAFTAKAAANLPLSFHIHADYVLTLPTGTIDDYSLTGEDYAYVAIDGEGWVRYDGKWQKTDLVVMNFYYPGYFDRAAETLYGPFGGKIASNRLNAFLNCIGTNDFVQGFYWDDDTETIIDFVYWFDGTWSNAEGELVEFPTRYAAGDFYPNSTAIVYRISYDMGEVEGATHDNPTGYTIETRFVLGDASAPTGSELAFLGWTDEYGNAVTEIDPIAIGRETECLYDFTLYANWGSKVAVATVSKTAAVMPGELAAYYDTSEAAQAAATAFNADKPSHICVQEGFEGTIADYAENFEAFAVGSVMAIRLTESAKESIASRINGSTIAISAELADPAVRIVTVTDAEPGFYYSVLGGTAVDGIMTEGQRTLAQEPTVEIEKPILGPTDKAFYKVKASVKP